MSRGLLTLLLLLLPIGAGAQPAPEDPIASRIARLADPRFAARQAAEVALRRIGARALPALEAAAASHAQLEVRRRAARLVRSIREDAALAGLTAATIAARLRAIDLLVARDEQAPYAVLSTRTRAAHAQALTDVLFYRTDSALRKAALEALVRIGPPRSLPGLLWAWEDQIGHLQKGVIGHLKIQGTPAILRDVALASARGVIGADEIARAIRTRHPGAVTPARPMIDRAAVVRRVAAGPVTERLWALRRVATGMSRQADACVAVAKATADADARIREVACEAFRYLPVEPHGPALVARLGDPVLAVQRQALLALTRWPHPTSRAAVLALLRDGPAALRLQAASVLGDIGDAATARALTALAAGTEDAALAAQLRGSAARIQSRVRHASQNPRDRAPASRPGDE